MKKEEMKTMFHLSFLEEVGNTVSHGVMALICLILIPFSSVLGYVEGGIIKSFGFSIFMICLFLMFLVSTLYHSMEFSSQHKYIFRKLDHICIYLAIAGTYTPVALTALTPPISIIILGIEWALVIVGILLKSISKYSFPKLSMFLYLLMGWIAIMFVPTIIKNTSITFMALILLGGILYSIGAVFYSKKQNATHFIWHIFIILASISHMVAILCFL